MRTDSLFFDEYNIKKAEKVLRAVNHELRRNILRFIQKHGGCSVTDIYVAMRMEQSVCSQHLGILRAAGVVSIERLGKHRYYSVVDSRIEVINALAAQLVNKI